MPGFLIAAAGQEMHTHDFHQEPLGGMCRPPPGEGVQLEPGDETAQPASPECQTISILSSAPFQVGFRKGDRTREAMALDSTPLSFPYFPAVL